MQQSNRLYIRYGMPPGINGASIEDFLDTFGSQMSSECKEEIGKKNKDGVPGRFINELKQKIYGKKIGFTQDELVAFLNSDRYFTTKGDKNGFTEVVTLDEFLGVKIATPETTIYLSRELKTQLDAVDDDIKIMIKFSIISSFFFGTGQNIDKSVSQVGSGPSGGIVKDLSEGKLKVCIDKTICELRPQPYGLKNHWLGDIRMIGWNESTPTGRNYYFTEIGMHEDIAYNILKVISCLMQKNILLDKFQTLESIIQHKVDIEMEYTNTKNEIDLNVALIKTNKSQDIIEAKQKAESKKKDLQAKYGCFLKNDNKKDRLQSFSGKLITKEKKTFAQKANKRCISGKIMQKKSYEAFSDSVRNTKTLLPKAIDILRECDVTNGGITFI